MNYLNKKNARARRAGQWPHRNGKWPPSTLLNGQIQAFQDHHRPRCGKARLLRFRVVAAFQVVPVLCTTQTHHRRRRDDDDPKDIFRLARDRACWPAGAANGRWAWRGRGARHGSCRVRVVCCRAERRRGKFKRKRRSGVMVCVSVFVTHQEARGRF